MNNTVTQMHKGDRVQRPVRVEKPTLKEQLEDVPLARRSELCLLQNLIERNPERAQEFLRRLKLAVS